MLTITGESFGRLIIVLTFRALKNITGGCAG
jgi:hypothetical protein